MLEEIAFRCYRGRNWWSFLCLWYWWEWRDSAKRVYCSSVSDLFPNGFFFCLSWCIILTDWYYLSEFLFHSFHESINSFQTSDVLSPELQATFNTIIEAFLFLDKNGDGKLHKKDVVKALNEDSPWEKSPAHVTRTRFSTIIYIYIHFIYYVNLSLISD